MNPRPRRFRARRPNHFAMLPPQAFNKQAKANTTEIALLTYAAAQLLISCSIFVGNVIQGRRGKGKLKFMICLNNILLFFIVNFQCLYLSGQLLFLSNI